MAKIALASDHGGFALKEAVKAHLLSRGEEVEDFGTHDTSSCDYPDYGIAAAKAVADGTCDKGILVCTTGIGISMAANKVPGIRCALLSETTSARLTREHNDANVMALGGGFTGPLLACEIVDVFLDTPFSGEEKHSRRIAKVMALDERWDG
ncbi:MAG: ribose 5-phosphate isomerase B [Lachnospiraceae bacterium]|nr:ribose 5-phosphate isomerase B [Lachnospiraceae bacterium]